MDKKIIILVILAIILMGYNIFFTIKYFSIQRQYDEILDVTKTDDKIKFFNNIFINKVLKSQGEVSYENRLELENAAVNTNDNQIIAQWHNLLESQTEEEAQKGVIDLLVLFAK